MAFGFHGFFGAHFLATPTTNAVAVQNGGLFLCHHNGLLWAQPRTFSATDTKFVVDFGFWRKKFRKFSAKQVGEFSEYAFFLAVG